MKINYKLTDLKICLIGLLIGLILGLILLRGFIFSNGLTFWLDLRWEYSSSIYPNFLVWNEYTQNPVIINHLIAKAWLYLFSPEIAERLLFIILFMIMGVSMFYSTYKITSEFKFTKNVALITSFISTVFFIINPIVAMRLGHWLLLWFYAFLPILFYFSYSSFRKIFELSNSELIKKAIIISLVLFLMSASIRILYFLPIFFMTFIICLSRPFLTYLKKSFLLILSTLIFYIFLSFIWILPLIFGSSSTPSNYIITNEVLGLLSRNSNLLNVISLRSFWATNWFTEVFSFTGGLSTFWMIILIFIPILAFISLIFKRKRIVLFFGLFLLVLVFLAKGSNPPFEGFYNWFIFDSPVISNFGWMFRGANKWNLLLMFTYTILIGFTTGILLSKLYKIKKSNFIKKSFIGFFILGILLIPMISGYPLLTGDLSGKMKPSVMSDDYKEMYEWIENQDSEFKIAMYPYPPEWSTPKPTIRSDTYYNFIQYKILENKNANIGKLLSLLNVKYLIVRGDILETSEKDQVLSVLNDQNDLKLINSFGSLEVFENKNFISNVFLPKQTILSTGLENLNSLINIDSFNSTDFSYIVQDQFFNEDYNSYLFNSDFLAFDEDTIDLLIQLFDDNHLIKPYDFTNHYDPANMWSKASTSDPLHGGWHPYLEERDIENWDFDYGNGIVFTWAPFNIKEVSLYNQEDQVFSDDFEKETFDWIVNAANIQNIVLSNNAYQGNSCLLVELNESSSGWKTISSSLIPCIYGNPYRWEFFIKGENVHSAHIKIVEYSEKEDILQTHHISGIGSGNFNWKKISFSFIPSSADTEFMQLQIWHGHNTSQVLPNKIWLDDLRIYNLENYVIANSLDLNFNVEKTDEYELFIRYFQNIDGGKIGVNLDNKPIDVIHTANQINKFIWKHIKSLDLTSGEHTLTILNKDGFNAVNLFALISSSELEILESKISDLVKEKQLIYPWEAETDLYMQNSEIISNGKNASNGEVVILKEDSKLLKDIYIPKDDNYIFALGLNGSVNININNQTLNLNSSKMDYVYQNTYLEKGNYKIEILPDAEQPYIWTFNELEKDLEDWKENTLENGNYSLSIDQKNEDGCLLAELNESAWGWKLISSPLMPIVSNKEYIWSFEIKGENAHSAHGKIIEYNSDKEIIHDTRLGSLGDGTFDWKDFSATYISTDENISYMQLQIWHGHNTDKSLPNKIWLDNIKTYSFTNSYLDFLYIYNSKENNRLEDIFNQNDLSAEIISITKVNPTKYIIKIKANEPFMLAFTESYDSLWRAYENGYEHHSMPLYSVINGFWINNTGEYEITLRYKTQDFFEIGSIVTLITLIFCISFLFISWKKESKYIKKIKNKIIKSKQMKK